MSIACHFASALGLLVVLGCGAASASSLQPHQGSLAVVEKGTLTISSVSMDLDKEDAFPAQSPESISVKVLGNELVVNVIRSLDALARSGAVEFTFVNPVGEPHNWPKFVVPTSDSYVSHPWMAFLSEVLAEENQDISRGFYRFIKVGVDSQALEAHRNANMEAIEAPEGNIVILNATSGSTWDNVVNLLDGLVPLGMHAFVFVRASDE